jgi:nitrite reductase/ring-hydroxylating ferredoxin subunit
VSDNPARPGPGVDLCALDDLPDPGARGFRFREDRKLFAGFVVRLEDSVRGFIDSCPHAGWPMGGIDGGYLTRDQRHILCGGHAALFRPDDGVCVAGPCAGDRLAPWPVRLEAGRVITA